MVKETAILLDHENGTVLVDTNVRSVASLLQSRGFIEKEDIRSKPYRRFVGTLNQVSFRKGQGGKGDRKIVENSLKNLDRNRGKRVGKCSP